MKKLLSVILAALMLLAVVPMASFAEDVAAAGEEAVVNAPITWLDAEFAEAKHDTALVNEFKSLTENVTVTDVKWFDVAAGSFKDELTFGANKAYIVYLYADTAEGYTFDSVVTVAAGDYTADTVTVSNEGKSLTAVFNIYCYADPEPNEIEEIVIDFSYPKFGETASANYFLENKDCTVEGTRWFEVSSDKFIDEDATFGEGKYYIEVTLKAADGNTFSKDVKAIINGSDALSVTVNEDGTVTAIAEFSIEKEVSPVLSFFQKLINTVKTVFLTIVRFFGTMIGLK